MAKKNTKQTSPKVIRKASKIIKPKRLTKTEKSVAGPPLTQARRRKERISKKKDPRVSKLGSGATSSGI